MAQQTFEELVDAVKQAESRGKRYKDDGKTLTTSAKGALGEMQVMPKTITKPGFGVTPARDKSPDEIARVGKDYLQAMLGKYGDTDKALVAYNWGPGSTDKWIAAGANPEKLPAETRTYVQRVKGFLGKDVPRETSVAKKEREPLPPSLPPMAQAEPSSTRATMAKIDVKSMPASYQAAFALAALADAQDEEDDRVYNENKQTESEKLLAEYKPVNHLASLDLGVTPINFADGGEVDEDKGSEDIKYFSNVDRMKERGTTIDSVMLGARKKAGEGSFLAGLNMANMSKDEKLQTARALMAAYTHQDPQGVGINANVIKPLNPKGPAMANLLGSLPVGEGRVSAGLHGGKAFSLGYNQPIEGGQFNANLNIPRGNPSAAQLNLQYNKRFADGGEVEGEDLSKPSFGNPNIRKQGEAARRLAAMRDVNTLPDPKTYAAVAGALGTRPDQMGFSVLNPKYKEIMDVANPAFYAGTALQIAPVAQGPGMGRMVGAAERALEPAVRRTLEGGGKASEMLQALAAPPSQMFVRARPEAIIRHAQLSAKGLSPEEIRVQNLTHVDNRGNLLEEISDAPAVLQQKTASVPRNYYEMLKHPELESIYPTYNMPDVMMETTKRKGAPLAMGTFNVQDNRIMGNIRDLPQDDARGMVRGTLLHEGQHAIQEIEGFTGGANPGAFIAYVKARQGKYNADPTVNENVIREMERAYPNLSSVADNFTTRLQADKYMRYAVRDPDRYVGETLYRHMPGEVQAELARVRSNLSPEQLKATPHEVSMQQLGIDPANILVMNKMGSRPDKQIGDVDYDPSSYANGGPVYRADGSPPTGERKLDRETMDMLRRQGTSPASLQRVAPPADINSSAAGLPGLMLLADPRINNTNAYGYVLDGADDTKNRVMSQAMFLNKSRAEDYPDTIAHETEHLLARQNLGSAANINSKFDELIGNKGTSRLNFVRDAVKAAPYLKEKYDLQSSYLDPKMFEYQSKFGLGKNLLYEQLASLAALEQRHKIDLTKDPELRKTLFSRPDVRETYNALTGLRQTRLDPRDLPPHTRVPEPGMLDAIKGVFKRADGGIVQRADGSPEEGEVAPRLTPQQIERIAAQEAAEREAASTPAFIAQKSGIGRKAGPVSQALQSGQGYIEAAKGFTMLPQNLVGAAFDLSNMVAGIYGGNVEKPIFGSENLKEQSRKAGIAFKPSDDPTLAGFFGAGDLGSNLVNPAGLTRAGVKAAQKTGEAVKGTASDLLAKYQATQAPKPKMMTDLMTGQQFEVGGEDYIRQQFANIAAQRRANATNVLGEMPRMQTPQTEPPIPVGWGEVDVTPGEVLDAQQALRAQRAEREAQQAAQNAQQQPQQLALPLEAPVEPPVAITAPAPAPKVTSVAPPVTMKSTVTPSNPFVGRLDNFVATLKGSVTKDQLLGQLRGKFRDYDLNRVEQALEDLKPTDKIKPADLKQRLDNMFSPRDFRLGIVEPNPQAAGIHNLGMDNPFIDDKTKQMGVINLLMETPKEKLLVHRETSDAYAAFEQFKGFTNTPEQIQLLKDFFVKTSPEKATTLTADLDALTPYVNKIKEKRAILGEVVNAVELPILSKKWTRIQYEMAQQYPDVYADFDKYKPLIDEAVIKEGLKDIQQNFGLTPPPFSLYKQDPNAFKEATKKTLTPLNNELTTAENDVKQAMAPIGKEIESLIQGRRLYRGQHSNLNEPYNQNNPVAFSRFTDHEALIGDQGTKSGMYVHELQSDRFDDLIKKGPKGGSPEKDKKELIALNIQVRDKVNMPIYDGTSKGGEKYGAEIGPASDRLNIFNRAADAVSISYDKIGSTKKINELFAAYPNEKELIKDAIKIAQRQRVLSSSQRIGSQAHQLEESFAGMETSPQVVQQLLAKNAIVAAMQRGKEFVAFPGKESSQSQLYEKLPANLKQVVKDLGSGFEIRPIELPVGDVDALNTLGVTWSPEAAARILKTGVPFNKGGMVERQPDDNRRYL